VSLVSQSFKAAGEAVALAGEELRGRFELPGTGTSVVSEFDVFESKTA
tara:strand:+ start:194 stop:337 length:144 start_codon:yes stop_codon:yes gene_type:complete